MFPWKFSACTIQKQLSTAIHFWKFFQKIPVEKSFFCSNYRLAVQSSDYILKWLLTFSRCRTFAHMKQIFPRIRLFSVSCQETQWVSFTQSDPSPGLTFTNPGIRSMCFQPALNKTLCFTPPPPTYQTFKQSKLQNKKIRLSASAPPLHPTSQLVFNRRFTT